MGDSLSYLDNPLLLTKRGKNYQLATKKLTEIYRQPTKVEIFNRQPTK